MNINYRTLAIFVLLCGVIGFGAGYYMFQKEHDNLADLEADYSLTAIALFHEYEADESKANGIYLDKLIQISGTLAEKSKLGESEVVLFIRPEEEIFGVSCAFSGADAKAALALDEGTEISIKGICTGINMDVNLVRCVINE
ncbi:MAG: hypothetical protein AAF927_09080 [Bacteroidota bacterium]